MRLLFFFKQKKLFVFFVIFLFSSNCFRNWIFKLYYFNGWSEIPVAILDLIWQWDKRSLLQISICSKQFREFGSSCIQTVHSNLAQMGGFNFRIGLGLNWKWMWFKFSCIVEEEQLMQSYLPINFVHYQHLVGHFRWFLAQIFEYLHVPCLFEWIVNTPMMIKLCCNAIAMKMYASTCAANLYSIRNILHDFAFSNHL